LLNQPDFDSVLAQVAGGQIDFKVAEAKNPGRLGGAWDGAGLGHF
jgi:hypothetical protein